MNQRWSLLWVCIFCIAMSPLIISCGVDPDDCTSQACPSGKECKEGRCVTAAFDLCRAVTCPTGQSCMQGVCCTTNQKACGGACVDIQTSSDHCGACNNTCGLGLYCQKGSCVPAKECTEQTCPQSCGTDAETLPGAGELPQPIQTALSSPKTFSGFEGFTIEAAHAYEIQALILSRKVYSSGQESTFSPLDLALGWGVVSQQEHVNLIEWSQGNRWYFYKWAGQIPITGEQIKNNSANTHIIPDPSQPALKAKLMCMRRGDLIWLKGYLVTVKNTQGWTWKSSTTRTDTGAGGCEIMYVTEAKRLPLPSP